jgi:WD40 repeat protein
MKRLSLLKIGLIILCFLQLTHPSCKSTEPAPDMDNVNLELKVEKSRVDTLSLDSNGKYYALGFDNGTIKLFDFQSGKPLKSFTVDERYLKYGKYDHIFYIDFSTHGRWLAAGSEDGFTRIWDIASGKLLHSLEHPAQESYMKGVFCVAFSADSRLLASASSESVILWDAESGKRMHTFSADAEYTLAFSGDGRSLVGSSDDHITVWDVDTKKPLHRFEAQCRGYQGLSSPVISADGKKIAYMCIHTVFVYDLRTQTLIREYELPAEFISKYYPYSLFYNKQGELLAAYLDPWKSLVKVFNVDTQNILCEIVHLENNILFLQTPDGFIETKPESAFSNIVKLTLDEKEYEPLLFKQKHYKQGIFDMLLGLKTRHDRPGYGGPG